MDTVQNLGVNKIPYSGLLAARAAATIPYPALNCGSVLVYPRVPDGPLPALIDLHEHDAQTSRIGQARFKVLVTPAPAERTDNASIAAPAAELEIRRAYAIASCDALVRE
jgi:hypothetical protein